MPDTEHETRRAIEAILMVAEKPVEPQLLAQLLEIPVARVDELCEELAAEYEAEDRGFALVQVAGGWRFQSHADLAPYVERFVLEGQSARLSAPPSRRSPSSPTSSRSPGPRSRRSAASTSTA